MRRTAGEARMAQMLLDSIRYGFAPTKVVWDANDNQNRIVNIDPRRCFPDPRVSWGEWEQWQFCVFTDYQSYNSLINTGLYPKLKDHPELRHRTGTAKSGWQAHRWHKEEGRGLNIDPAAPNSGGMADHAYFTLGDARVTDECWVRFSGHDWHSVHRTNLDGHHDPRRARLYPYAAQPIRSAVPDGDGWPL